MNRLTDRFGRQHTYLRISVTDRCNLRCQYCMPPGGVELKPRNEISTFGEIEELASIFVGMGIQKIRITGGEPLVRKGVEKLCAGLARIPGLQTLALSSNGVYLDALASKLRDAGVQELNISLDTLRADRFAKITLRAEFDAVLRGIGKAYLVGFPSVKINTVVIRGFNDDELLDFVDFALRCSLCLRFIEYMPFTGNSWTEEQCITFREMKGIIEQEHQLEPVNRNGAVQGPAQEFRVTGSNAVIGFIPTVSEPFCGACNRLRLSSDGKLRTCLFATGDFDLLSLLRVRAGKDRIEEAIHDAVMRKWKEHPPVQELATLQSCSMVSLGG